MASPFPGMDPYLEGEFWQEFHETLANALRAQLMSVLSPKYVALLAKRYGVDCGRERVGCRADAAASTRFVAVLASPL